MNNIFWIAINTNEDGTKRRRSIAAIFNKTPTRSEVYNLLGHGLFDIEPIELAIEIMGKDLVGKILSEEDVIKRQALSKLTYEEKKALEELDKLMNYETCLNVYH